MLQLKAIQHAAFQSQETHCYSANLYVDGKLAATVGNEGHGGCDYQYPKDKALFDKALLDVVQIKGYRDWDSPYDALESWCCNQVNDYLAAKDLKRLLSKRVLFTEPGMPGIYQTQCAKNKATKERWLELYEREQARGDKKQILNLLPFDTALKLFKEKTQ